MRYHCDMPIHAKDEKQAARIIKGLTKPARKRAIDDTINEIPDAAKVIEKLEREIAELKKRVSGLEKPYRELWKAHKERKLRGDS